MTETELKPCPFCGGKPNLRSYSKSRNWIVFCSKCETETQVYESEQEAVKAWNSRPIEDAQEERIKHLQKKRVKAIEQNYKNAFDIQKYALKENSRLRQALEVILDAAQKDEPCVMAIKAVAYMALKGDGE